MPNNQVNWQPWVRHLVVFGCGWLFLPAILQFELPVLLWLYGRWASRELQSISLVLWAIILGSQLAVLFDWPLGLGMAFLVLLFGTEETLEQIGWRSQAGAQLLISIVTTLLFFWPLMNVSFTPIFLNLFLAFLFLGIQALWEHYA